MTTDPDNWGARGACRELHPDALFVDGAEQHRANPVCTGCPVRITCLGYALDQRIEHGIWGGQTPRERRQLLRRRPTVRSWRTLLDVAQADHEQRQHSRAAA
jgi:WhiB family redox-sensing transcriptional regulator